MITMITTAPAPIRTMMPATMEAMTPMSLEVSGWVAGVFWVGLLAGPVAGTVVVVLPPVVGGTVLSVEGVEVLSVVLLFRSALQVSQR